MPNKTTEPKEPKWPPKKANIETHYRAGKITKEEYEEQMLERSNIEADQQEDEAEDGAKAHDDPASVGRKSFFEKDDLPSWFDERW